MGLDPVPFFRLDDRIEAGLLSAALNRAQKYAEQNRQDLANKLAIALSGDG